MKQKYELKQEVIRQTGAILAGLIGISVVIVQALIAINATDPPAVIALLAFAIALPMLSTLVILIAVQVGRLVPERLEFRWGLDHGSASAGSCQGLRKTDSLD